MKTSRNEIARLCFATLNSCRGLFAAFRYEAAFRLEVFLSIILLPVAWLSSTDTIERLLLIGVILLVLIVELLNSAIETVVDRVGIEFHELSGRAKDIGSAAVFISLVFAALVWGLILLPKWFT